MCGLGGPEAAHMYRKSDPNSAEYEGSKERKARKWVIGYRNWDGLEGACMTARSS